MTDIKQKALALVNEVLESRGRKPLGSALFTDMVMDQALLRSVEQHEAFKREVSDAVEKLLAWPSIRSQGIIVDSVAPFIIPKPDPLVEAIREMALTDATPEDADRLRAALAARGLEVRKIGEGE